jgi:hypothetical protein
VRWALSPPVPADFIHIRNHINMPELLRCGWGPRSQAYCASVQAPSCNRGTSRTTWALRPYTSGILGPFDACKDIYQEVLTPQPWCTDHSTSQRPLQGQKFEYEVVPWRQMKVTKVVG